MTPLQQAYGLQVPQNLQEACDPKRLALIVYDMQVGVLRQIKDGSAVAAKVAEVRTAMAWQRVTSVEDVNPWFLRDMGDAFFTDLAEIRDLLRRHRSS